MMGITSHLARMRKMMRILTRLRKLRKKAMMGCIIAWNVYVHRLSPLQSFCIRSNEDEISHSHIFLDHRYLCVCLYVKKRGLFLLLGG